MIEMNSNFKVIPTDINGVKIVEPFCRGDQRGFFAKYFEKTVFEQNGIPFSVTEEFESGSQKGVLRGLHFQTHNPQSKLVHVSFGAILDVVVDLRKDSPTYKKWISALLNDDNHLGLYVPKGCAHGFKVLSDYAVMTYMCEGAYDAASDSGIRWDDPDINVDWQIAPDDDVIISDRDRALMSLCDFEKIGFTFDR